MTRQEDTSQRLEKLAQLVEKSNEIARKNEEVLRRLGEENQRTHETLKRLGESPEVDELIEILRQETKAQQPETTQTTSIVKSVANSGNSTTFETKQKLVSATADLELPLWVVNFGYGFMILCSIMCFIYVFLPR